jgi:hypothetical protein
MRTIWNNLNKAEAKLLEKQTVVKQWKEQYERRISEYRETADFYQKQSEWYKQQLETAEEALAARIPHTGAEFGEFPEIVDSCNIDSQWDRHHDYTFTGIHINLSPKTLAIRPDLGVILRERPEAAQTVFWMLGRQFADRITDEIANTLYKQTE